jgi:hypothetical protein
MAKSGNLYLASLVPGSGSPVWVNTIVPDFAFAGSTPATYNGQPIQVGSAASAAMGGNFNVPLLESWSMFMTNNPLLTPATLANYVGDYGVDTTNDVAWAVVDHNSEFAVVPEPSAIVLAAFGLIGGLWAVRRKKSPAIA